MGFRKAYVKFPKDLRKPNVNLSKDKRKPSGNSKTTNRKPYESNNLGFCKVYENGGDMENQEKYHTSQEISDRLGISKTTFLSHLKVVLGAYFWKEEGEFVRGTGKNKCYTQFAAEVVEAYHNAKNRILWVDQIKASAPQAQSEELVAPEPELVAPEPEINLENGAIAQDYEPVEIVWTPAEIGTVQRLEFNQATAKTDLVNQSTVQSFQVLQENTDNFAESFINLFKQKGKTIGAAAVNAMIVEAGNEANRILSQTQQQPNQ